VKRLILIILSACLLLAVYACSSVSATTDPLPPYSEPESYAAIQRNPEQTEILLEDDGLWTIGPVTVDENGNIYVVSRFLHDRNTQDFELEIQKIDGRNEPYSLIKGLDNVIGLSAAGNKLYIFEQREHGGLWEYHMLTYSLYGELLENRVVEFGELLNPVFYYAHVFQDVPVAIFLSVKESSGPRDENDMPPYIYNLDSGELKAIDIFLEQGYQYYGLRPLPDGRIIAHKGRYVGGALAPGIQYHTISVNADMSLTAQDAPEGFLEISSFATTDMSTGNTYALLGGDGRDTEIYLITDDGLTRHVLSVPYSMGDFFFARDGFWHIVNRQLYIAVTDRFEGINKIVTLGIPD